MTPEDLPAEVFAGAPHKLTMGLRPLDMSTWLDPDPTDPQLAYRRELLSERRNEVFGALPGSETACREVAAAVFEWVGQTPPGVDQPLVEAALAVRDDLCVLQPDGDRWLLVAAVVCFPSRWRLADKLGRDVLAIHGPVPGYVSTLGTATTSAFAAIAKKPRWRVNWTLLDDAELFQPAAPELGSHRPGLESFLRVERQCLVPVEGCVVFSIRTTVVPVADLPPDRAAAVLAAAAGTPDDLAGYRGWSRED